MELVRDVHSPEVIALTAVVEANDRGLVLVGIVDVESLGSLLLLGLGVVDEVLHPGLRDYVSLLVEGLLAIANWGNGIHFRNYTVGRRIKIIEQ